ncbi:uncharacterized protein LY89DRAFT_732306 [Mollisia scopiformis]|uniref:Zn(2)-C6 fungal-type domain-containing protein n=1 Tax=Mollisia scopiformis TaxID=149040 RepID=A0A194XF48_MOLSC|nr:uncharacterized protein LY89DRAFT_732306 [Mollisia scopiformis]KUJ18759.1 hypothetical protein LY89DRAFT_732306 [Mollisia scopiformis]
MLLTATPFQPPKNHGQSLFNLNINKSPLSANTLAEAYHFTVLNTFDDMPTSRSGTGCWTCRLRKKKCDDARPVCGPCSFRDITCHGYGPKPDFLCSTEDQKREIAKIQRAVSDSFKARRAFRVSKKASRPSQIRPVVPATTGKQDETVDLTEAYKTQLNLDAAGPSSLYDQNEGRATALPFSELWPEVSQSSFPSGLLLQANSALSSDPKAYQLIQDREEYPRTFLANAYPAQNAEELSLIISYLERSFPLQFYFYQPTGPERGRGWLLALILRSKPSYYTILAFSVLQQIRFGSENNIDQEHNLYEDLDRYHSLALIELQKQLEYLPTVSGSEHLAIGVEILACTMQLCSIEVFRQSKLYQGWKGDWEIHLNAAGSLLSIIGTELINSSEASAAPITADEKTPPESTSDNIGGHRLLDEIAGLDFFTTTYVWADIVRCTSDLEHWKLGLEDRLDVPMLYRRASEIEARLDLGLETIPKDLSSSKFYKESHLVTEIYALSALVYLAIVVSGNSPLTPKVRLSVPKVLDKIKHLPAHLLMRVSWPYCVAGCMAAESEKDDFRAIMLDATTNGQSSGTLLNSLQLMEEFWTMREILEKQVHAKGRSNTPWAIAMER